MVHEYLGFIVNILLDIKDTYYVIHHYLDHFEVTGETLLKYTDEAVEVMHSQIKQFEERHHYKNHKYGNCSKAHSQHKSTGSFW